MYVCYVCGDIIDGEDPHTYHEEDCPARHFGSDDNCDELAHCGEDVHPDCCPTCQ